MRTVIYPGSFDPITAGHVDIIKRLVKQSFKVIVLVANAPHKRYLFSSEERQKQIVSIFKGIEGVEVDSCPGLTTDYAKKSNVKIIVRGIRAVSDFEHEMAMAEMNKGLYPEIETMIVFSSPQYSHISSGFIK